MSFIYLKGSFYINKEIPTNQLLCDVLLSYYYYYKAWYDVKRLDKISMFCENESETVTMTNVSSKKKLSNEFHNDMISDYWGTVKTFNSLDSIKVSKKKLIKSVSEWLINLLYLRKAMDPELFIATLNILEQFLEKYPPCK